MKLQRIKTAISNCFLAGKGAVLIVTLTLAFPCAYGQEATQGSGRQYVKVEVDGLACPFCAYGLEKKLTTIEGQQDLSINIDKGYATFNIPADNKLSKEKLEQIVEDAGYTPRTITFSREPYQKSKKDDD